MVYQLDNAYQKRPLKQMLRLARLCTNTGTGTKKIAKLPITSRPTTAQTEKLLMKPANEGGTSAKKMIEFHCNYDDIDVNVTEIIGEFMNDTYDKISPITDLAIHSEAVQDLQNAAKVRSGIKNGKATPPWGTPSEILKIIINPDTVFVK